MTLGSPLTRKEWLLFWLAVIFCLAFLLPNHYSPWLSVHQELAAWLAFVPLLAWASLRFRSVPPLVVGALLLAFVPLLQIVTGQLYFAADGWMAFLYLMGFAFAVLAGAYCIETDSPNTFSALTVPWLGVVLAALVSVGVALFQWFMLGNQGIYTAEMPPGFRPFGNLAQPNQLATLLLLGLAGIMFLWESRKLHGAVATAAVVLLTFGLVMTGSRAVLLAFAWLVPLFWLMRRRCHLRTTRTALALIVGFYLATSAIWPELNRLLLLAEMPTVLERMAASDIRSVYWSSMLDAIWRAPWAGYGWGQVGLAQIATALDYSPINAVFDSAHNILLDLALWNGLPVAVLVFAGLLFWGVQQVRQCQTPLAYVTLMGVGIVWSHAMVEYPLNYAYFLLPVGLWMGALSAGNAKSMIRLKSKMQLQLARGGAVGVWVLVLGLGAIVVVDYFPYEEDWRLMRFREQRIGSLTRAEPPPVHVLTNLHALMWFSRVQVRPDMPAQELEKMRRVSERYAYASSMFRYATAQALNHQPGATLVTLRRLCRMHSKKACLAAKAEWEKQGRGPYPQLKSVPFPAPEMVK